MWINQWACLALPTENLATVANGRDDAREALEKHQILSIYNNERIHLHIAPDLTPKEMKDNVKVLIEIDFQRNNQIEIDIRFVIANSSR